MRTLTDQHHAEQADSAGMNGQRGYLARSQALRARRSMKAFCEYVGADETLARHKAIGHLHRKLWHGRLVFRMFCHECAQERWVPESICWSILSLKHFICHWCMCCG